MEFIFSLCLRASVFKYILLICEKRDISDPVPPSEARGNKGFFIASAEKNQEKYKIFIRFENKLLYLCTH
jgi:hypothetical protein